jgi:hypothetical protein
VRNRWKILKFSFYFLAYFDYVDDAAAVVEQLLE